MEQTYFDLMMTQACESINVTPVTEGIIDTILKTLKTLFDKAIEFLKTLWEAIKGFFSKIWNRAVEFFNKHFKNDKKTEPVEIALIGESFNIKKSKFESPSQFINVFKSNCQKIQDKINKHSKENQDMMAKFKDAALREAKKESWEYLEEKVVTHSRKIADVSEKNAERLKKSNAGGELSKMDAQTWFQTEDEVTDNSVYDGKNLAEHIHKFDINLFKRNEMELIKASENVIEAYNAFADVKLKEIISKGDKWIGTHMTYSVNEKGEVTHVEYAKDTAAKESGSSSIFSQSITLLRDQFGYPEEEIMKFLRNQIFPDFDSIEDPDKKAKAIRKFVQLKINWNKGLVNTLRAMLDINNFEMKMYMIRYGQLEGITGQNSGDRIKNSVSDIKKALDNDDFKKVKKFLQPIIDDQIQEHPDIIDLSKFNLGSIVFSRAIVDGEDHLHQGVYESIVKNGANDKLLQYVTKYDVTVISHGGYDVDKDKWIIEPTRSPKGGTAYDDCEELIKKLISQGYKRINVRACNPGKYKLPKEIQDNKRVVVYMNSGNGLIN